ncbi:alpha/beta fold hydrolase [Streptomyces sp. IBSBF 2953]|uniref:thioesterase II family protein n=1 Tax=Streptomyces TaxID=1883 RepID=UPI00211A3249|nr:alpha/beta fold hydrolase [Streptomyces scabiei]MCQ9184101.1 alpha/beta fold hydrolase [Streptomyces hayashii]MDX3117007.1 alpha/beta fold hydrolase [Streptomyces scabiei]
MPGDPHGKWFLGGAPPADAETVLYCLPNAGGGGTHYLSWRTLLPRSVWVQPVQLPGRENRLAEDPRFETGEVADALREHADRPYVLYGHSMGGVLAFEAAAELARRGARLPERILVAASPAPQADAGWARRWAGLSEQQLLDEVVALGGVPRQVLEHPRLSRRITKVLASDVAWLANRPAGPRTALPVPIVALAGERDPLVRAESMTDWADCTSEHFRLHVIDGGHLFHTERADAVTSSILQSFSAERGDLHGVRGR